MTEIEQHTIPKHVAVIMDGNGRWATQKGKMRIFGHKNGVSAVKKTVSYARKIGIENLTLYAFSSENWHRPEQEVSALMGLFLQALEKEVKKLHKNGIRLNIIGDRSAFSPELQKKIDIAEKLTENNRALTLNIAANYGGKWDIIQATKQLANEVKIGRLSIDDIVPEYFEKHLVTQTQPPVDLLIRTGGEQRVSNFLLWQIAYAELYFSPLLWPDFDEQAFQDALESYQKRQRRFGTVE